MKQISSLLLSDFPQQGVLRTNIANKTLSAENHFGKLGCLHSHLIGGYKSKKGGCSNAKLQNDCRVQSKRWCW